MTHRNKNLTEKIDVNQNYSRRLISGKVTATAGIRNPENLTMVYGLGANRIEILRALEKQSKFKLIWYTIFIILGIACLFIEPNSWIYVLDLFIILINIDLVSKGKIIGVYIGIAECLLYSYVTFIAGLYGECIKMFLINIPLNIFTLISWSKNLKAQKEVSYKKNDENDSIIIKKLSKKSYIYIASLLILGYVAAYFGLKLLKTSALYLSAGALICSICSKILSGLRYKETWLFTIMSNTIGAAMWIQVIITGSASGSINLTELPAFFSSLACLSNAFYGYSLWKSMYRKVAINGGEVLTIRKVKIKKIIKLRRRFQKLVWNEKIDTLKNS